MMKMILTTLLLTSIFLVVYNYFLYPLFIIFLARRRHDEHLGSVKSASELSEFPTVSLIIAAYNEERVIDAKIKNTLELDYPREKLEIIVVSDGSNDNTAALVKSHSDSVTCLHNPERGGKSAALNRAVEVANGELLVFSDANNDFARDVIKQLVRHFENEQVGAVTGSKHIYANENREAATGDSLYWRYEAIIKKAESHLGSITAAEGEILALRRSCYKTIDPNKINDDAAITFDIVQSGMRVLYEENARSTEQASIDLIDDINVKIRMTFGGFQTITSEFAYLFPPRHWFAFCYVSHKVLRWLVPHSLILIFITSLMLWEHPFVALILSAQVIFYSVALYGWSKRGSKLAAVIYMPMYFTVMNYALFIGFVRYLKNPSSVQWRKAQR